MKCQICKVQSANKKNSHIVPKFLGKGILGAKRRGYEISTSNPKGKHRIIQDIPKEDHLFCSDCELKLSILETYFANSYFRKLEVNPFLFKVTRYINYSIKSTNIADGNLINLFVQSILWRQHISNHPAFINFSISSIEATLIQNNLALILGATKNKLIQNIDYFQKEFSFFPYIMRTHTKKMKNANFIVGIPDQKEVYLLILNSIRINIGTKIVQFTKRKRGINLNKHMVNMMLVGNSDWEKETYDIISRVMIYSHTIKKD